MIHGAIHTVYVYIHIIHKIHVHTSCKDTFFKECVYYPETCFRLSNSYVDTDTGAGIGAGIDTGRGTDAVTDKHRKIWKGIKSGNKTR